MVEALQRIRVRYADAPASTTDGEQHRLHIPTDGVRGDAKIIAELERPGVVRDLLATAVEILESDLRYKARDRAEYLQFLLSQGATATAELWQAQKDFLAAKYGAAETEQGPLDPIVTVSDDGIALEVFSGDESAYARVFLKAGQAYKAVDSHNGTTHISLSKELAPALTTIRSYRETTLELSPADGGDESTRDVPYRWIRAFGQVQAAATLPAVELTLAPVDLYNVLYTLRSQRAKKSPRALRYELVPGEQPQLVLEPWDLVINATGDAYAGDRPMVVRTWGRRRLLMLARVLPHAKSVRVRLFGPGLPAYYVVDMGDATLTLSLSGWTDSGWAGIATFDLLVADPQKDDVLAKKLQKSLDKEPKTLATLTETLERKQGEVRSALLWEMQKGELLLDVATGCYRRRPLFAIPLDTDNLRYRDAREKEAHRLLDTPDAVTITRMHDLGNDGVRIEGEVDDPQAHRSYRTSFTLDREGRTVKATCTSPQFRRSGLKEGPSVPMIALRLCYARHQAELERARQTPEGRKLIVAETRTLVRRAGGRATTYRVSLDDRQVVTRWGTREDDMRVQRLFFQRATDARDDYFARLDRLSRKGFIDASAAEAV